MRADQKLPIPSLAWHVELNSGRDYSTTKICEGRGGQADRGFGRMRDAWSFPEFLWSTVIDW